MNRPRPLMSRSNRLHIAQFLVLTLVLFLALPERPASAGANLIANPGLENLAANMEQLY